MSATPRGAHPGHAVLQCPVPPLDPWVRQRTAFYDTAYLSDDALFTHAHVTVLGPFTPVATETLEDEVERTITRVARATTPFVAHFDEIATFPTGIIHLRPDADAGEEFLALTARLRAVHPDVLPYGGRFVPDPHLTLDLVHRAADGEVTEESTRASVQHLLPVQQEITHLDLAWYAPGECRLLARWELGTGARLR